jgi:hypothetical protein
LWTEEDFEIMGWHDWRIYAVAFDGKTFESSLDIDYIVNWISPAEGDIYYRFWVSPATSVFANGYNININLDYLPMMRRVTA